MFAYYFQLGLRSLRRNPLLTGLMIITIAFGVAASMTMYSVFRAVSNNPIPQKSSQLFAVQVDNFGPQKNQGGQPPDEMDYIDAMALLNSAKASRQAALYPVNLSVIPNDASQSPIRPTSYAVSNNAFRMFDVPFQYGGGWGAEEDGSRASVVVIGRTLNDRLFHGSNSVGREINLSGHNYRIAGVMDTWDPKPLFFDLASNGGFADAIQLFIPMSRAVDLQLVTAGGTDCPDENYGPGWDAFLRSSCSWVVYWAELPSKAEAETYREYLRNYAAEQQRSGRYAWPPNVRLRDVSQWLDYEHAVPPESRLSLYLSLGFLLICLVNTVGLLLAKFMRRAAEIGVRRALGASRQAVYAQFLIEGATIGLAGGVLGLLLTGIGVGSVKLIFDAQIARLASLDLSLVALTLAVAVLTTLVAAFYPTWRAAQVAPAWQLKSN